MGNIQNPHHSGSMYMCRNYKQYVSIVLQAVSGPDYRFLATDVGTYGKESDDGIFRHSNLFKKLEMEHWLFKDPTFFLKQI